MNQKERKQVRISHELHKEMAREKVETGLNLDELVEVAWGAYKRERGAEMAEEAKPEPVIQIEQSREREKEYTDDLRVLAAEIGQRAAAVLDITGKIEGLQREGSGSLHQRLAVPETDNERATSVLDATRGKAEKARGITADLKRDREDDGPGKQNPKRATG
jgi:hypothetical protein